MSAAQAGLDVQHNGLAYRRGVLLVLAAGVCWSSMGVGIRLMETASAWQILLYRSLSLTAFLFVVLAARSGGRPVAAIRRAGLGAVLAGGCLVGAFAGGVLAVQLTTVANAMFLFAASPFFAALLGRALIGESVRAGTWKAMALAAVGVGVMVANGVALGYQAGNAMALLAALSFACFTVALRWGRGVDMMPAVFHAGVLSALAASAALLISESSFVVSRFDLSIAVALGVVQVGLGLVLCTIGARSVPAAEVALITLSEVILGPLWVWLLMDETPSALTLLGGGVLLAALVVNAATGMRRRPPPIGLK